MDDLRWFVHFPVDRHLGCVHFSSIRTKAAMNSHMYVCGWTYGGMFSILLAILHREPAG